MTGAGSLCFALSGCQEMWVPSDMGWRSKEKKKTFSKIPGGRPIADCFLSGQGLQTGGLALTGWMCHPLPSSLCPLPLTCVHSPPTPPTHRLTWLKGRAGGRGHRHCSLLSPTWFGRAPWASRPPACHPGSVAAGQAASPAAAAGQPGPGARGAPGQPGRGRGPAGPRGGAAAERAEREGAGAVPAPGPAGGRGRGEGEEPPVAGCLQACPTSGE